MLLEIAKAVRLPTPDLPHNNMEPPGAVNTLSNRLTLFNNSSNGNALIS